MNKCIAVKKITADDLRQFSGTSQYYHHKLPLGQCILLTDGCHFLRKYARCHWLFSDIASHLFLNKKLQSYRAQRLGLFWSLFIQEDESARLVCSYDKGHELGSQQYSYSDIGNYIEMNTLDVWTFPTANADGSVHWVALLPSEY